ncbi:hypothetical protein [Streptomyces sp. NPDC094049]|uniref:beta family protein n=1 Tax=Streptomyces sp. NPDC094049 TaxID=3154987 RepID=UPI0033303963
MSEPMSGSPRRHHEGPPSGTPDHPSTEADGGRPAAGPAEPPLYVPALPARPSALDAYDLLPTRARACVTPLWTVPPPGGGSRARGARGRHPRPAPRPHPDLNPGSDRHPAPRPGRVDDHLRATLERIEAVQRGRPAWVDAFHTEGGTGLPAGDLLRYGRPGSPLRPVTGVERPARQQTATAETALGNGDGLGVRVPLTAPPGEALRDATRRLLRRVAFAHCPVDLLLDLRSVLDEHHPAEKWALRALDLLVPLHPWRTVVLLAGSFPHAYPGAYGAPLAEAHRFDWDLWHMVVDGPERPAVPVVYGDYGADHAGSADRPPRADGGAPWGTVRYTMERTFVLARVPTRGPDHADAVRASAREIVCAEGFRGGQFSRGERWLLACASGARGGNDGRESGPCGADPWGEPLAGERPPGAAGAGSGPPSTHTPAPHRKESPAPPPTGPGAASRRESDGARTGPGTASGDAPTGRGAAPRTGPGAPPPTGPAGASRTGPVGPPGAEAVGPPAAERTRGSSRAAGTGGPGIWLRVGHLQHMAQVVRALRRRLPDA